MSIDRKKTTRVACFDSPPRSSWSVGLEGVIPLTPSNKVLNTKTPPPPRPHPVQHKTPAPFQDTLSDHPAWQMSMDTDEPLQYLSSGISAQSIKRLRRGHWAIENQLDLHGLTLAQARPALAEFIARSHAQGLRCIRIIHGKGLRSPNGQPVLKTLVASWLMQCSEVLAYCQALANDGGSGAVNVLLKSGAGKSLTHKAL